MSDLRQEQIAKLERLKAIQAKYANELNDWQRKFVGSILTRYGIYGASLLVSDKQWDKIEEILGDYDV